MNTAPPTSPASVVSPPFRAVLLDDNPDDAEHFNLLLRRHPSIRLVGQAVDLKQALEIISREPVDVLFLESELEGESLLDRCPLIPPSVRLIFITRQPAAAVQAFDLDAVDFLVKPLAAARLSETVRRLLRIEWERPSAPPVPATANGMVLIPFERGRRGASLTEISIIQACGNYTRVVHGEGKSEIALRSLAKWEQILPMPPFLRVHRNAIVHTSQVRALEDSAHGSVLRLANGDELVPVSRRCLPEVRQALFATHA